MLHFLIAHSLAIGVFGVAALFFGRRVIRGAAVELRLRARNTDRADVDLPLAAEYHVGLSAETTSLDDRTWRDLDLDDVFAAVDHTTSQIGRQCLYHTLRTPVLDPQRLASLETAVRRFTSDDTLSLQTQNALSSLNDPRAGKLANLFLGDLPQRPALWWLFPMLTAGSLACLASIAFWPRAFVLWIAICIVNVLVQIAYKPRMKGIVPALHEVPRFVQAAKTLGALDVPECAEQIAILRRGADALTMLRRATLWLMFEPGQSNELAASLYEYVNLLFLIDANACVIASTTLQKSRDVTRAVYEALGYLDVVQSIAAWRATLGTWTTPTFTSEQRSLRVESIVHPLLTTPVANSLEMHGASALITGSNMSGKTTFIRTIGVNAVLAATLHTVCAATWVSAPIRVRTSIGRSDSILEGKSYYLAEVESIGELIRAKEPGVQHLFLLDEIFRGTNTTERVAAAFAVLSYLNRGDDLVIVATHDIEVIDLLGAQYTSHHFREEIADGTVAFDYKIHAGPASSRNAIALLELMKYPSDVVSDAIAALDWQSRSTNAQPQ